MKKNLLKNPIHSFYRITSRAKSLAMLVIFIFLGNNAFGQAGAALTFDGADDYVEVGNIMPATYTKEAWINASALSISNNVISGGSDGAHALYIPSGTLSAGHNGQWNDVQDSTPLNANTWYHVAVTYDKATTTMKLYKNGVLVDTNTDEAPFDSGNALRIGAFDSSQNLFKGSIDEVRIWNRVLSQTEIQNTMGCELPAGQTGLVAYYQFNQGVNNADNTAITALTDASGNNNNGTLTNFALTGSTSNWVAASGVATVPTPTRNYSINGTLCNGATVGDLISKFNNSENVKCYSSATSTTPLAANTVISPVSSIVTFYLTQTIAGCESARLDYGAYVNVTPPPIAVAQTFCYAATVANLVASTVNGGCCLKWYDVASGGTPLVGTAALATGTYYVTQNWMSGCESARTSVNVTTNTTPTAPTADAQTLCNGSTVADLIATSGTNLKWYFDNTTPTALLATDVLTTHTYYVSQTINGCESVRTASNITITNSPAPTAMATQIYSGAATIAQLTATGTDLKWYEASVNGVALPNSTELLSDTTYYVSQTNSGCESARTAVMVHKISESTQTTCYGSTISSLLNNPSAGTNVFWYSSASGGTALATTDALSTATYYVEQVVPSVVSTFAGSASVGNVDGLGTAARFNYPTGLRFDVNGNLLVADQSNSRIRKISPSGNVSTFAGSSWGAADGTGTSAQFGSPFGITTNAAGEIFVSDYGINMIRKIDASTFVSKFAGNGFMGLINGSTWATTRFASPAGIAADASGNLFVADSRNSCIRKISPSGVVTTFAGSSSWGLTDGIGAAAKFSTPYGITIDALGFIYVTDSNRIRKINPITAEVTTVAGSGTYGNTNGNGIAATFSQPQGLTTDSSGNIYVADTGYGIIRKISPTGDVTTFAGSSWGYLDGNAATAQFQDVTGIVVDAAENLLVADASNNTIRKITQPLPSNRVAVNVIVNSTATPTGLSTQVYAGTATLADLSVTGATTIQWHDAAIAGNLLSTTTELAEGVTYYASQTLNSCESSSRLAVTASKISELAQTFCGATTVANLVSTPSNADARWYNSALGNTPLAATDALATGTYYVEKTTPKSSIILNNSCKYYNEIAIEADGKILVLDTGNSEVIRMNADGTNNVIIASGFYSPKGIAVQADGKILIADTNNNDIKRMNADGTNIVSLGSGFNMPSSVAVRADGTILVADTYNQVIKSMNADGTNIQTFASGLSYPMAIAVQTDGKILVANNGDSTINRINADGSGKVTLGSGFLYPYQIAVQTDGTIVIADTGNNQIKSMNADGTNIQTLASGFLNPYGVAVTADNTVLVADSGNIALKKIIEGIVTNRVAVSVTLGTPAPTANAQTFCNVATVADLVATGTDLLWYSDATLGTALAATDVLTNTTYYVSQTVNSCESERTAVLVTVATPAPKAKAQTFCNLATVADLVATGTDLLWYSDATLGTALAATDVLTNTTYYVSQTVNSCESERTAVLVTINATPAPTGSASQTFCGSETVSLLNATGTGIIWYDAATLGTVVPNSTVLVDGMTYYASQTIDGCESASRLVVTATASGCLGLDSFDTSNLRWYPNPTKGILNINYSKPIDEVRVINLLGQTLLANKTKANEVQLDLSSLPTATYFIKVVSEGKSKMIKVIKQ